MPRKILRPCAVCRRPYAAAYLVPELGAGKGYVCRACWEAIQAGQIALPPGAAPAPGPGDGGAPAGPPKRRKT
jgi:hypothetical protein